MADPTEYDLVQDQRLDELETLVTPQPKPSPGTEYSFPVVGQDVSDSEYRQMMLAQGDGVLDQGGRPYWLRNLDNATDTAQLTVSTTTQDAQAVIKGFFHRLTQDMTISLPPVTTETVYHICLTLDPLQSTNPLGPISVQVYAGEPPTSSGRIHVVLWKHTRQPNQTLTAGVTEYVRPKIAPTITVDKMSDLPQVQNLLWGTVAIVSSGVQGAQIIRAGGTDESGGPSEWVNLLDPPFSNPGDTATFKWPGHGYRRGVRRIGDTLEFRGRIAKSDGSNFLIGGNNGDGYQVYTLDDDNIPAQNIGVPILISGSNPPNFGRVEVYGKNSPRAGAVAVFVASNASWVSLDGVRIPLE